MPVMTAAQTLNEGSPSENVESPTCFTARIVQRSGSSFYWAMRVLDPERRAAIYAIYAFCRAVDDIADGTDTPSVKLRQLADWRGEIERVYHATPETPIGRALSDVVARYPLAHGDFLSVIKGMETDASACLRMADMAALSDYVDRVACAVGRLCTPIFGLAAEHGQPLAEALGEALQLTNIVRDLDEDAARNRLYLPLDRLAAAGISEISAATGAHSVCAHSACAVVCDELACQAQARFHEVAVMLSNMDPKAARAPRLMMAAYQRLLEKIIRAGWKSPRRRVSLSRGEKLWIVVRHGWF